MRPSLYPKVGPNGARKFWVNSRPPPNPYPNISHTPEHSGGSHTGLSAEEERSRQREAAAEVAAAGLREQVLLWWRRGECCMTVRETYLPHFPAFLYIIVFPQIFLHILHNSARPHFSVGFFLRWGGAGMRADQQPLRGRQDWVGHRLHGRSGFVIHNVGYFPGFRGGRGCSHVCFGAQKSDTHWFFFARGCCALGGG